LEFAVEDMNKLGFWDAVGWHFFTAEVVRRL
jgi:hypothetical protein